MKRWYIWVALVAIIVVSWFMVISPHQKAAASVGQAVESAVVINNRVINVAIARGDVVEVNFNNIYQRWDLVPKGAKVPAPTMEWRSGRLIFVAFVPSQSCRSVRAQSLNPWKREERISVSARAAMSRLKIGKYGEITNCDLVNLISAPIDTCY
ncbi:MAG: hypothetical protein WC553_02965 [Patescibacteria group bacterium]|jgi:RES domain-containing protein